MFITTYSIIKIIYSTLIWTSIFPSLQCFFLSNLFKTPPPLQAQPITFKVPEENIGELQQMLQNNPEFLKNIIAQSKNGNKQIPTISTKSNAVQNQMNGNLNLPTIPNAIPMSNPTVPTSVGNLPSAVMINGKKFVLATRAGILQNKLVNFIKNSASALSPTIKYSTTPLTIDLTKKNENIAVKEEVDDDDYDDYTEENYSNEVYDSRNNKKSKGEKTRKKDSRDDSYYENEDDNNEDYDDNTEESNSKNVDDTRYNKNNAQKTKKKVVDDGDDDDYDNDDSNVNDVDDADIDDDDTDIDDDDDNN